MHSSRLPLILLLIVLATLVWSGITPADRFTWFLEVVPVLIVVPVLVLTRRTYPLTGMLYVLIALHAIVLMVGGRYTYAEVPLFNWIRDTFDLTRNYYDRVGHLMQGLVPAIAAREILLRSSPLKRGAWLTVIAITFPLSISLLYELLEWLAAAGTGEAAEAFLGTQGDVWDTQKDMAMALVGALAAMSFLQGLHDRALGRLQWHKEQVG